MNDEQQMARMAELLTAQLELYRGLCDLSQQKRTALVQADIQGLEKLIEAEQVLLWRAARMEDERIRLQQAVITALGLDADASLAEIADHLDVPGSTRYRDIATRLREIFDQLQQLNEENSQLISRSLEQINMSVARVCDLAKKNNAGPLSRGIESKVVDSKL